MKKALEFLWLQPLHKSLRQLRFFTFLMLVVSVDIMYRLIGILEQEGMVAPEKAIGVVGTLAVAVFAAIWKGIGAIKEQHLNDE